MAYVKKRSESYSSQEAVTVELLLKFQIRKYQK